MKTITYFENAYLTTVVIVSNMKFINLIIYFMLLVLNCFGQPETNQFLIKQLDSINTSDQVYRNQLEFVQNKYGGESAEMRTLWVSIKKQDSVNLIKVEAILAKYGWLGSETLGHQGNSTLFLVIQHSDLATQMKYLPMMRDAVAKGNAEARSLALLEDRVSLLKGGRQIYGSQLGWNMKTNDYYILPLEDPDNVDERRATMGLQPLSEYVKNYGLKWDIEQYKKDLPAIEIKFRSRE